MALDYANFELVQNIKRNLRGTAPKDKLSEIEDKIQIVIPVNSAAAPISVREEWYDQDSAPKNYITTMEATNATVANATWTTMVTITVPAGYNYYLWGWYAGANGAASKTFLSGISDTTPTGTGSADTWLAQSFPTSATSGAACTIYHLTRPLFLPAGTTWYGFVEHDFGGATSCTMKVFIEVRKLENRDP